MSEVGEQAKVIVGNVQKKGDTLDPLKRVTGRIQPRTAVTAGVLSSPLLIEALDSNIGLQYLVTHPVYSVVAGGLMGAIYGVRRMREKRKSCRSGEASKRIP